MKPAVGRARCPGTCGEWVQGARDGQPFLIDCPIDRYAEVEATLKPERPGWTVPRAKTKASRALDLFLAERGLTTGGELRFLSQLPVGKGMASSTADIAASVAATLFALGETPDAAELAHLALRIEPSDSVMFPGITEINHVQGNYYKVLGPSVPAQFLALDWGGMVDTISFNLRFDLAGHYRKYEHNIGKALGLVRSGVEHADLEKLALGGTISALCNLEINPKPHFGKFKEWVRLNGGLGVITAHSGTLLAGVFESDRPLKHLIPDAEERFQPASVHYYQARDGGVQGVEDWNEPTFYQRIEVR
ncbi:GHMP family kinase ATP-binding protein [Paradesulfitobacterium ferrireducens]|uniref:GHMP family kinase ATP-binding protein n=1 Tax=Paradesulfitobacterium ferrireducens TaxID=2816476 RepID=UPI001A8C0456|nr:GHMP kinase [Paradesulfitobacterium ferrireducens]